MRLQAWSRSTPQSGTHVDYASFFTLLCADSLLSARPKPPPALYGLQLFSAKVDEQVIRYVISVVRISYMSIRHHRYTLGKTLAPLLPIRAFEPIHRTDQRTPVTGPLPCTVSRRMQFPTSLWYTSM